MKKLQILLTAALLVICSAGIQAQSNLKADAVSKAKEYTTAMAEALNITDASKIKTLSSLNENYFRAMAIADQKNEMTEDEKTRMVQDIETNRYKRFLGVLDQGQMKMYEKWNAEYSAASTEVKADKKSTPGKMEKAAKKVK